MNSYQLAYLSLTRRKISTILALVAISLSVAFSGVLLRLYLLSATRFSSLATGPETVVGAKAGGIEILLNSLNLEGPYPGYIPYTLYASLAGRSAVQFADGARSELSSIKSVIPFVYFGKLKNYRLIGTDLSFFKRPFDAESLSFKEGNWVSPDNSEIVIGSKVAEREGIKLNDNILIDYWTSDVAPSSGGMTMKVVGILNPTGKAWDYAMYSSLNEAWKTLKSVNLSNQSIWKEQVLNYFLIYVEPKDFISLENLINRRTVAQVISVDEEIKKLESLTGTGRQLGLLISFTIVCLGALGVTAMMVTRFDAMSVQLAVLRAIGFEKKEIRSWLLWEGILLGVSACCLGALLDSVLFPWVRGLLENILPPANFVSTGIFSSSPVWLTAVLATIVAVFIPLYRLYHQDVHSALRG